MNINQILVIVVGLVILGLVWKVIAGILRLILTLGLIAVVGYFVLTYFR